MTLRVFNLHIYESTNDLWWTNLKHPLLYYKQHDKYCLYLKISIMVYIKNIIAKNRTDIPLIVIYKMNTWFLLF